MKISVAIFYITAVVMALSLQPHPAHSEDASTVRRVSFREGRAVIQDTVKGYGTKDYVFPAGAGESVRIDLKSNKGSNYFNAIGPGDKTLFIGSTTGATFEGVAPTSGDYTARVYLLRNDARRGVAARYTLTIALGRPHASAERGPDFADGMAGGPDAWEVSGVADGDTLNMRGTPSPTGKLLAAFLNGTALRNLGCRNTRGQRWCRVEDDVRRRGWVNGRYLRER
jgi:hypothetical protein